MGPSLIAEHCLLSAGWESRGCVTCIQRINWDASNPGLCIQMLSNFSPFWSKLILINYVHKCLTVVLIIFLGQHPFSMFPKTALSPGYGLRASRGYLLCKTRRQVTPHVKLQEETSFKRRLVEESICVSWSLLLHQTWVTRCLPSSCLEAYRRPLGSMEELAVPVLGAAQGHRF